MLDNKKFWGHKSQSRIGAKANFFKNLLSFTFSETDVEIDDGDVVNVAAVTAVAAVAVALADVALVLLVDLNSRNEVLVDQLWETNSKTRTFVFRLDDATRQRMKRSWNAAAASEKREYVFVSEKVRVSETKEREREKYIKVAVCCEERERERETERERTWKHLQRR